MRTTFFLFAMFASITASAQVTNVEPVGANYANKTVSFRVWWNAGSRDATHLSKVWVWVEYIKVNANNTTSGNTWTRAVVSAASPTASVSYDGSNRKGFWLQGNSGSYSVTITVQLNITETKFNWCAYVSDYPPNVTAANGTYTFKGTPPFTLTATNGTTSQTVTGTTLAASALTITPTTIRDKTECPGIFCIYTGSDLYIDATHLCQQRTSGAQNWEAWIKDTRDNELYRIVKMPDNNWWLAQNLKYAGTGAANNAGSCTKDLCGRWYTATQANGSYGGTSGNGANKQGACPNGWVLPVNSTWQAFTAAISGTISTVCQRIRAASNNTCQNGNDYYGWASIIPVFRNEGAWYDLDYGELWRNNENTTSLYVLDHRPGVGRACGEIYYTVYSGETNTGMPLAVRCFRQL